MAHQQRCRWYRRLRSILGSRLSLCRILIPLFFLLTFSPVFLFLTLSPGPADAQQPPTGPQPKPPGEVLPPPIILPIPPPSPSGLPKQEEPRVPSYETPQEPVAPTQEAPTGPPPAVPPEVPRPPTEFQPPPPSVQFPLLPPVELGPATPETPLKPIPLGLAPPFQPEGKWFALQLALDVEEVFTDNAFQTNTNRQSEWSTRITPGISLGIDRPQAKLNLAYFPSFFISNNGVQDNTIDQFLALQGSWQASPYVRVDLSDGLTYSNQFLAFGDIGTLRTGTNPTLTNTASGGIAYTPAWGRLAASYTTTINQTYDVQFPDNSLIQSGRISADLIGPNLSVGTSYTLTRGSYDISSDYWEQIVGVNAAYPITQTLNGKLLGSLIYHKPDSPIAVEYFTGDLGIVGLWQYSPTGRLELGAGVSVFSPQANQFPGLTALLVADSTTQVRPSVLFRWSQEFLYLRLSAQYSQLYVPDFGSVEFFNLSFRRSAGIALSTTGSLFRNLTGTLGVNWVQNDYPLTTINVGAGTTQDTFNVDFGVRYYLFGGLSLNLDYVYTIRDSTNPTEDFYENRFRIGLTYQYNLF